MNEIWKDIQGYQGIYQISNIGRVKSLEREIVDSIGRIYKLPERVLLPYINSHGYACIHLYTSCKKERFSVHRLVCDAFYENPENKPFVNHIDGNKQNNNSMNLEWCTRSENELHAFKIGLKSNKPKPGRKSPKCKAVLQYDSNDNFIREYESVVVASQDFDVPQYNIARACRGGVKMTGGYKWRYKDDS